MLDEDHEEDKDDADQGFKMRLQQIGYEKIPSPNDPMNLKKQHSIQKDMSDYRKISHESDELKARS